MKKASATPSANSSAPKGTTILVSAMLMWWHLDQWLL